MKLKLKDALEKIEQLEISLEQSKAANKRIKEEVKYLDYRKLEGRFFSKCRQLDQARKALDEIDLLKHTFFGEREQLHDEIERIIQQVKI